jgi:hypothetical protein
MLNMVSQTAKSAIPSAVDGHWRFLLLLTIAFAFTACGGGGSSPSQLMQSVSVSVSPSAAAVVVTTQTQQFTGAVTGTMNTTLNWSVDGVAGGSASTGTIDSTGLYTPPGTAGMHTVTATSAAESSASASATVAVTDLPGVFTHHNDLSRDGVNAQEYALTPGSVNTSSFGKLFSCATATQAQAQAWQGAVFTQTLWVPSLAINGGVHNVIFVATQHDAVFAFDADANPCVTYWQVNLLDPLHGGTSDETPVVWNAVGYGYGDIYPEVGVVGTPVIDPSTNTMYLVSTSMVSGGPGTPNCPSSPNTIFQRLHALDLITGNEKFNAPVSISATVSGVGDGGTTVTFCPQMENQRSALTLANGVVYIGWSAHEDASPWHGWLMGYNAANLRQLSVFNSSPNSQAGGIWAAGGGAAVDSAGNIYVSTGNGNYDATLNGPDNHDYGDSVVKLTPFMGTTANGQNLNLVDWFTPENQASLNGYDIDLGAGEPMILPDQTSGRVPNLLVEIGKEGVIYLINRDDMGQYSTGADNVLQTFVGSPSGFYGTPAFWQNSLYFGGSLDTTGYGDYLKMFSFNPTTGMFATGPASQSTQYFNFPGVTPSISSQGASDGIVWAIDASSYGFANPNANSGSLNCAQDPVPSQCIGPAVLHAYDATNLSMEYWNSNMMPGRDQAGNAVKFVPPTIANGKVYVSTRTEVDVYGLLP